MNFKYVPYLYAYPYGLDGLHVLLLNIAVNLVALDIILIWNIQNLA